MYPIPTGPVRWGLEESRNWAVGGGGGVCGYWRDSILGEAVNGGTVWGGGAVNRGSVLGPVVTRT